MTGIVIASAAGIVAGALIRQGIECWAVKRERRLRDALRQANLSLYQYQVDEAYRAGQAHPMDQVFEAPVPLMPQVEFSFAAEPPFPDVEKAQNDLLRNRRVCSKRISGIWVR